MLSFTLLIAIAAVAAVLVVVAVAFVFWRANQVDMTGTGEDKPDWVRSIPPPQTLAATRARQKDFQMFNHQEGERLASPFAEQIEDVLQALLREHPELNHYHVDLGTAPDGGLEIWVNEQKFDDIDDIPDDDLRDVFRDAIEIWQNHTKDNLK